MLASGAPQKLPFAWASRAGSGDILPVSLTSLIGIIDGRASLPDGFVPLNFEPVDAGGIPPYGGDHNGILNWLSLIAQWFQAGGPVPFDAAFAASIGGYPKGARVVSARAGFPVIWQSLQDNNSTNPDAGTLGNTWAGYGDNIVYTSTNLTLTAQHNEARIMCSNALVLTLPSASTMAGLRYRIFNSNVGAIVTLNTNGGNIYGYGTGSNAVNLNSNSFDYEAISDGSNWIVSAFATFASDNSLNTRGNVGVGGQLVVVGSAQVNGNVNANGNIGTAAGAVVGAWVHSTGDAQIDGSINANGNVTAGASVTGAYVHSTGNSQTDGSANVNGPVTAQYGRLTFGAAGSGDVARMVTLGDFVSGAGPNGFWMSLPNGIVIQGGYNAVTNANFLFPEAFPNACFSFICGNADQQGAQVDNAFGFVINRANYYVGTKQSQAPAGITSFPISWIAWGN